MLASCPRSGVIQGIIVRFDRPPIGLRYVPPTDSLRTVVSSYYVFHADLSHFADMMRADLPQIRFMISGWGHYHLPDGTSVRAPDISLIGPTFGATRFSAHGPLLVVGIGLLPAGWASLIREDASQYADRVVDAVDVLGGMLADTLDALRAARSHEAITQILDAMMRVLYTRVQEPPLWFTRLTDHWLASSPSPEVDQLVHEAGMSGRQVERLARRIYGGPPKLLARKYRALKAASALAEGKARWQDVAGDAFFDQSHFIREFKQFTGITPTQLINNPTPVTRLSFERRKLVGELPELTLRT